MYDGEETERIKPMPGRHIVLNGYWKSARDHPQSAEGYIWKTVVRLARCLVESWHKELRIIPTQKTLSLRVSGVISEILIIESAWVAKKITLSSYPKIFSALL
jgi:hypothetical protein